MTLNKNGNFSYTKNTVKLSPAFQPETLIKGKEEVVKIVEEKK
jgi:hypothetical protein